MSAREKAVGPPGENLPGGHHYNVQRRLLHSQGMSTIHTLRWDL